MHSKIITSLFLNSIFVVSLFAQMEVEVYHKIPVNDSPNDNQVVPHIKIENTGGDTIALSDITVEYYMYETGLSVSDLTWRYDWCNLGNIFNVQFFNLDEPYTEGDKKANMKFLISFTSNNKLLQGQYMVLHIGIYKNDWSHNFNETVHWSYAQNTSYTLSDSIVVRDVSEGDGVIISGTPPPAEQRQQIPYPENCGRGDSVQVDGRIFLNPINDNSLSPVQLFSDEVEDFISFRIIVPPSTSTGPQLYQFDDLAFRTSAEIISPHIICDSLYASGPITCRNKITCDSMKTSVLRVTTNVFPDYVFSSTHSLKSLPEIDQYIRKYKRLPGFPTGEEVKKHGMNVGEIQVTLVEKLEEMTLLVIQLEKRIKELENAQ